MQEVIDDWRKSVEQQNKKIIIFRFSLSMIANYKPTLFNFHFVATPNALLEIQCPANAVSKFKFEVKAISDNSKAKLAIFEIRFNGTYTKDLNIKLL